MRVGDKVGSDKCFWYNNCIGKCAGSRCGFFSPTEEQVDFDLEQDYANYKIEYEEYLKQSGCYDHYFEQ